jgi:succinate dehydrogenase/fumarate reductase cytochrome b subunit
MDFEHAMTQSNFFLIFQMLFMGSLLIPTMLARSDLYSKVARVLASQVVSFGPIGMLVYVLYHVSRLN